MDKEYLIGKITKILLDKKCRNVLAIDVSAKTDVTEAYILCTAKNPPQAKSTYEEICAVLENEGIYTLGVDGLREGKWIVMDYDKVIVHIFHTNMRDQYRFEELWSEPDESNVTRFEE